MPPDEPLTAIGLGSNLLVRDGGIRGTVVVLHAALNALEMRDGLIYAEAGVASPKVARFAAKHGFAEAEFLAGIPGHRRRRARDERRLLRRRDVALRRARGSADARRRSSSERTPSAYAIGYRSVRRADGGARDGIFTAAWFAFPQGDARAARARIAELLRRRIATQPLNLPNAGSVFRNPPGDHAARLIESCGLKGYAVGGARVSEKHANFIVNPAGRGEGRRHRSDHRARPRRRARAHRRRPRARGAGHRRALHERARTDAAHA